MVHDTRQRVLVMAAQRLFEFEVAARRAVHDDGSITHLRADRCEVRECCLLRVRYVLQQGAGGGNALGIGVAAKA